jgi:hypothetical protein
MQRPEKLTIPKLLMAHSKRACQTCPKLILECDKEPREGVVALATQ